MESNGGHQINARLRPIGELRVHRRWEQALWECKFIASISKKRNYFSDLNII